MHNKVSRDSRKCIRGESRKRTNLPIRCELDDGSRCRHRTSRLLRRERSAIVVRRAGNFVTRVDGVDSTGEILL